MCPFYPKVQTTRLTFVRRTLFDGNSPYAKPISNPMKPSSTLFEGEGRDSIWGQRKGVATVVLVDFEMKNDRASRKENLSEVDKCRTDRRRNRGLKDCKDYRRRPTWCVRASTVVRLDVLFGFKFTIFRKQVMATVRGGLG